MAVLHQWINGKIVKPEAAHIGVNDLGLLRGMGIFDYFLLVNGKTIFMKDHIKRFFKSAEMLDMNIQISKDELSKAIFELIKVNGISTAGIRLVLTGGYAQDGYTFSGLTNLFILQHNYRAADADLYKRGLHLMTHNYQRELPEVKSTNYLLPISLKPKMAAMQADDVLYTYDEKVSEASRANFFIIDQQNNLITSTGNVLKGITRTKTLEIAHRVMNVEIRPFSAEEMWDAKEAFITSTTKGILAVTKIDNKEVGDGVPGAKTLFLASRFEKLVAAHVKPK